MLALDHIIWVADDIEKKYKAFDEKENTKTVAGGNHVNWGTYNALTHLSNQAYIEWLGVNDDEKAQQSDNPLIAQTLFELERGTTEPIQFALRTTEMDKYVAHFKEIDLPFIGPIDGKRKTPSGQILTWRMLFPIYDFKQGELLPFLIEWDQPSEDRVASKDINHKRLTDFYFKPQSLERFKEIYHLDKGEFFLSNVNFHFSNDKKLAATFK